MKQTRILLSIALIGAVACLVRQANGAELINNGGFESGFAGWSTASVAGSDGAFLLQSGTSSPVNGTSVPPPPGPVNAAMTDARGPGTHVLYQDFTITAPVGSAILSFDAFVGNRAGAFFVPAPNTLDFSVPAFNQQASVAILLGSASVFSTDVLLTVFQTNPGDPLVSGYKTYSADIASILDAHLNTPLLLRFAETDNVAPFQFGVDNVTLTTSPVPEPSSFGAAALGILLCLACFRKAAC
jgi:hypothetical protein